MEKPPSDSDTALDGAALRRAEQLDALDAIFPFQRRNQLATLLGDDDVALLRQLADEGGRPNTLRAIATDLAYIQTWCRATTGAALCWPAPDDLLLGFVRQHLRRPSTERGYVGGTDTAMCEPGAIIRREQTGAGGWGQHAPATIRRRLASWALLTRRRGLVGGFDGTALKDALRQADAAWDRARPGMHATAITDDMLKRLLKTCAGGELVDLRDRALLSLAAAAGGLGRAELAALRVDDLGMETSQADAAWPRRRARVTILIGDAGHRQPVTITGNPARAVLTWIAGSGIASGPLFRKVDQWGNVSRRALTPQSVNLIVKIRAAKAGLDPRTLSSHGLRVGRRRDSATDAVADKTGKARTEQR